MRVALKLADNKFLAYWIISDLIRKDLSDKTIYILASLEHNTPGSPNPYDRGSASVGQTKKKRFAWTREERYLLVVKPLSIGYKRENERRKN